MNDNINEIEIALRDGMIDELAQSTEKSIEIIQRMTITIERYQSMVEQWEAQNKELILVLAECVEQRDRAREIAVHLEQECDSCTNKDHHAEIA